MECGRPVRSLVQLPALIVKPKAEPDIETGIDRQAREDREERVRATPQIAQIRKVG
jgi:hypothetical protein